MDFDIESTIEDNIRLKKALQMARFQSEKFEKELKQLKQFYQEEQNRNKSLKAEYCELNRKYQQSFTESIKDSNSLISQIEELKNIIDEKQRDMEQLQIKLIPSLDQDMLRVKLITEMQGPYQETVDRKDKEIEKLKNRITQLQRNLEITSLGLKSKAHQLKKENNEIKSRYQDENNRLMQELNMSLSRNQTQSVQSSLIKNQKKQIQQLKSTLQFVYQSEQKHLEEIKQLKNERNSLLEKLMLLNTKEALLLQGKHNMTEIEKLKDERLKQMRDIEHSRTQNQKLNRQLNKLEQQKTKLINQHQKEINSERNNFTTEKNQLNNQIYTLKQEVRRLKNYKIEEQSDREVTHQKLKSLEKELYIKSREIETLRLENSRITYRGSEPAYYQGSSGSRKSPAQQRQQQQKENDHYIINKKKSIDSKQLQKLKQQLNELKKQNDKLKNKLSEANQKILQLIRDKLKQGKNLSPQRDRTKSSVDKPMGVFLEYEDCAFKPLVEPTLYTYFETRK